MTQIYAETMDKLKDGESWDVAGIISDVSHRLLEDGDGEAAAVIDSLIFAMHAIVAADSLASVRGMSARFAGVKR